MVNLHFLAGPAPQRPPADVQRYGPHFQGANNRDAQPWFQYSQCTGKKKGLFVSHLASRAAYQT